MKITTRNFTVPNDLQPYISSVWFCTGTGDAHETSSVQMCLPTGMCELILHTTDKRHTVKWKGEWMEFPEAFLTGVQTERVEWTMTGGTQLMGISIKPEAFVTLFRQSVGDLADNYADARDIMDRQFNLLIEQLKAVPGPDIKTLVVWSYFREKIATLIHPERQYFAEAIKYIRCATGTGSVDELCGKVFVGKRQLQRSFQQHLGISPKTYGRIVRFHQAYSYVQQFPDVTWTDISHNFGYADQSHFIRDFKAFAGENPSAFMSGFLPQAKAPFALKL